MEFGTARAEYQWNSVWPSLCYELIIDACGLCMKGASNSFPEFSGLSWNLGTELCRWRQRHLFFSLEIYHDFLCLELYFRMSPKWHFISTTSSTHKLNRISPDDRCPHTFVAPSSTTKSCGVVTSLQPYSSAHAVTPAAFVYILLSGCQNDQSSTCAIAFSDHCAHSAAHSTDNKLWVCSLPSCG